MLGLAAPSGAGRPAPPLELWLYERADLSDAAQVRDVERVWRRAAHAGYRHVVLADAGGARSAAAEREVSRRIGRLRALASSIHLEVVPEVFELGPASALLAAEPDLAEGLPVRGAPFVVHGGLAVPADDPHARLGPRPDGADAGVRTGGDRVAVFGAHARPARVWFKVAVTPFRCYRVDVRVRTGGWTGAPRIQVLAGGEPVHLSGDLGVSSTQAWNWHRIVFNSLDRRSVTVYFGDWQRATGTLEWRDWSIHASGPVNVLRRASAPVSIVGGAEGVEVEPIRDPSLGRAPAPGRFDDAHDAPPVRTRLADGAPLEISWEHAALAWRGRVACCLAESGAFQRLQDEARRARGAWGAGAFLMAYDSIGIAGWDAACGASGETPGQLLAAHVRRARALIPGARAYVFSDLFDPYQGARPGPDLVRGDLRGSWGGLAPDVCVVDRNRERPGASIRFFAGRGYRLVIAGDGDGDPRGIRRRLEHVADVRGIEGVMYLTARGRYDNLEAFGAAARAAHREP